MGAPLFCEAPRIKGINLIFHSIGTIGTISMDDLGFDIPGVSGTPLKKASWYKVSGINLLDDENGILD